MLGGHGPDDHGIGLTSNPTQLLQILQVNQMLRPSQSELHHRNEAVSAGDDPCVFAMLRQKLKRGPAIHRKSKPHLLIADGLARVGTQDAIDRADVVAFGAL